MVVHERSRVQHQMCTAARARGAGNHKYYLRMQVAVKHPANMHSSLYSNLCARLGPPSPSHRHHMLTVTPDPMHNRFSPQQSKSRKAFTCDTRFKQLLWSIRVRSEGVGDAFSDISALNQGKNRQEVLSSEVQTGVADVADIDRSAELFLWIFQSIFGQANHAPTSDAKLEPTDGGVPPPALGGDFRRRMLWCQEAVFRQVRGVVSTRNGYAGGHTQNPTYDQVSAGLTGHAEVVQVLYNPTLVQYKDLLKVFFASHDPTQAGRQGEDIGPQYRSIVLYHSWQQQQAAQEAMEQLTAEQRFSGRPLLTQLLPAAAAGTSGAAAAAAAAPLEAGSNMAAAAIAPAVPQLAGSTASMCTGLPGSASLEAGDLAAGSTGSGSSLADNAVTSGAEVGAVAAAGIHCVRSAQQLLGSTDAPAAGFSGAAAAAAAVSVTDVMEGITAAGGPPPSTFYAAEEQHQDFYEQNCNSSSYCSLVVAPKLDSLVKNPRVAHLLVGYGG